MEESLKQLQARLQQFADERDWDQFHAPKNLVMALSVEASELLEHFQWLSNEESHRLDEQKKQEVAYEMADVFIYLVRLATKLDVNLATAVEEKIAINEAKYPADKVRGSHKKYTEYQD
ncbi:MAG: nucleotide pyrophosphohydrolase [Gammaproteobacteria bacterium]|nr:nucleotide pyrophosphohydrolase [Gammaproteobacteria bacterium]